MSNVKARHVTHLQRNNHDEGVCQYRDCRLDIPNGITMQLCNKHLRLAYAAFLIANPEVVR